MSIAGHAGWPTYDTFLIMSRLGWHVYDPNPLRPNPNPQKLVLGSCRVRRMGWTLTPLEILNKGEQGSIPPWSNEIFFIEPIYAQTNSRHSNTHIRI